MDMRTLAFGLVVSTVAGAIAAAPYGVTAKDKGLELNAMEALGKAIFFDKISDPDWMSCSTCHAPATGWTGPIPGINKRGAVYRGAVPQRFGNRKPPSAAYANLSPVFHYDEEEGLFEGGNFWDGRATGQTLGNPAADQARGPFLNPVEQHNYDKAAVCEQVAAAKYASLYEEAWGGPVNCDTDLNRTYERIALSIAAYEGSAEVNQFTSKYDAYLAGQAELTDQEERGLELFEGKALCAACHPSQLDEEGGPPLFTDFTFDNLGVPKNPDNPFYAMDEVYLDDGETPINPKGREWVDPGLGGFLASLVESRPEWAEMAEENLGKHKVPTLRNVGKTYGGTGQRAYTHNGYFKSLKSIVHFYNTRDTKGEPCSDPFTTEKDALARDCWPEPEVTENVNADELGDLGLTDEEEDDIVAFLMTLSDGYFEPGE